jgi:hypothetical protein
MANGAISCSIGRCRMYALFSRTSEIPNDRERHALRNDV